MFTKSVSLASALAVCALIPVSGVSAQEADDAFNGFYVGVHAGMGRHSYSIGDRVVMRPAETVPGVGADDPSVVIPAESETIPSQSENSGIQPFGGGQIGFNFASDDMLFGVEADVSMGVFDAVSDVTVVEDVASGSTVPARALTSQLAIETEYSGSLRFRAGMRQQDLVFFGTAGLAAARIGVSSTGTTLVANGADGTRSVSASESQTHTGWTAGAGVLGWFGGGVIGSVEARYTSLGSKSYALAGTVDTPTVPTDIGMSGIELVVRLNYAF
ncbi:MAG: hypothetical protein LC634_05390 [Sphingomonadales bacterium]|nr:hypothetical protein [Sphingomonadales bacterium]